MLLEKFLVMRKAVKRFKGQSIRFSVGGKKNKSQLG